jgi:hypothetical protein
MCNIALVVASQGTAVLQQVRRALDAELVADLSRRVTPTQAHIGKLEMLEAATAELGRRGAL